MKNRVILLILMLLTAISGVNGQEYKKDLRSQNEKNEQNAAVYQMDRITTIDLLKALEMNGIRIFKFPLNPFDKKYQMHIYINEYVNGKKVKEKNNNLYYLANNTYHFFEKEKVYQDYIDCISFYTKTTDSAFQIKLETCAMSTDYNMPAKKTRTRQFYNWRMYSKTDWALNEEIPLLIYASSWYDEKYKMERFCGTTDLSHSPEETKELLDLSPHYFVISYKIFE